MTRSKAKPALVSMLLATAVLSVSACGRMADPMAPAARETERAPRDANARDLPEPATINRPNRQAPIDGLTGNPYDGPGNDPR